MLKKIKLIHDNYDLILADNNFEYFIPKEEDDPFIVCRDKKVFHCFFINNIQFISNFILYSDDKNNIINDLHNYSIYKQHLKYNYIEFSKEYSKEEYFEKSKSDFIQKKFRYYKIKNNTFSLETDFNLFNSNKGLFIEKRDLGNNSVIEKYYFFDINNDKLILSHHLRSDKPFEIIETIEFISYEYIIPSLKMTRESFYKPSYYIEFNDGSFKFEYIINGIDRTKDMITFLNELDIKNPQTHNFKNREIDYIKLKLKI